mgnify:CR=1 FL=1
MTDPRDGTNCIEPIYIINSVNTKIMRKLYIAFALLSVLFYATSCEKNEHGQLSDNDEQLFTALSEIDVETKTYLSSNSVLWEDNDEVSVFNGNDVNDLYQVKSGTGGKTTAVLNKTRSGNGEATVSFDANVAYYPYGSNVKYAKEGTYHSLNVTIPSEQHYLPGSFARCAMPMVAVTGSKVESELKFKNLFGVLKLQLAGSNMTVKSITIKGNKKEKLSGDATVAIYQNGYTAVSFGSGGNEAVKLVCNNVKLDETTPTEFYITLPPMVYRSGITVLVETTERTIKMSTNKMLAINRSKVKSLDARAVTPDRYESEDYSKDGEVTVLQEKTVGNGITLVLMGDGFIDKDMGEGGKYEQRMRSAMEHFFSIEPYKSFRDRFNVYMVKAVSKNEGIGSGIETVFSTKYGDGTLVDGDDDLCLQYACKIPGIPASGYRVHIIVAVNDTKYAGTCYMYSNDMCVGYCPYTNGDDEQYAQIIHHEVGGHGFGKLSDEYWYSGTIPEEEKTNDINWATKYGFYRNVDYTNDPAQIKWKSLLENPDYSGLVGIYEGGSTYQFGVWRSTYTSIMVNNVGEFNAVSRMAIYRRIMEFSGEGYSEQKFLEYDVINRSKTKAPAMYEEIDKNFVPLAPPVFVR